MHTHRFLVTGGKKLEGAVKVSGSKNAALPIIAATLLTDEEVILTNVPDIADIAIMEHILHYLGIETNFEGNTFTIRAGASKNLEIKHELVSKLRGSSLFLGPLLARHNEVKLAFPGGCVIGKRPIDAHLHALKSLGAKILESEELLHLKTEKLVGSKFTMTEASVTATENAIMAAVLAEGDTTIRLAASEPHVQDLCNFLVSMGAKIDGIGTHTLRIKGVKELHGTEHRITPDYLETGTLVLAAAITGGTVDILDIVPEHLDIFWQKLREVGVHFDLGRDSVRVLPSKQMKAINLKTAIFPSFPTDLQAPFTALLTQAEGRSFIFETLFEGRFQYLYELERMGLKPKILNPYQAEVEGPSKLKGAAVASCDIRAGAGVLIAALAAEGQTEISNIYYIDRGYERLDEKLNSLGAKIERLK
ncbi:UDP-N-acetylglucosamine 1-carboxyvinyltransferase [Patescibacteria group bacterium]|nr:UDP-N-acetylglucosamine 1-carboxyvinyltransferase [Patescibacteria group bacterium]MBU1015903.1 UDP-N-acetylglucosamine 1-carboxyvinyltransferase [Patescibacteria group bacterium]MBU1685072.1 UDP-N-acetylglucosamine 1-carboxyvinyltransferase [Patescibacteria group bacterium]MBU1938165.1 UDP-N-acetylglucosamine 1-carboxyvinyltransferase [Patescibacteria group bacterium]